MSYACLGEQRCKQQNIRLHSHRIGSRSLRLQWSINKGCKQSRVECIRHRVCHYLPSSSILYEQCRQCRQCRRTLSIPHHLNQQDIGCYSIWNRCAVRCMRYSGQQLLNKSQYNILTNVCNKISE